jgi:hypothetical protein
MTDDEKITAVLFPIQDYAFGDIEFLLENPEKQKPIAALILCSCLIDQMAGVVYSTESVKKRYQDFIEKYLPQYNDMDLFENLRNKLVHNYSVGAHIKLATEIDFLEIDGLTDTNIVTAKKLLRDLKLAFNQVMIDVAQKGQSRTNALQKFMDFPPFGYYQVEFSAFDEVKADFLIRYYSSLVIGAKINGNRKLSVTSLEKYRIHDNNFAVKAISKNGLDNGSDYAIDIATIAQQMGLLSPLEALEFQD